MKNQNLLTQQQAENQLINQKSARLATETATGFLTQKNSIYIILLFILAICTPFLHLVYAYNDGPGLFGFAYMSSFLYALALPVDLICAGLLILVQLSTATQNNSSAYKTIALGLLFVGGFFMLHTLIPMNDLPVWGYMGAIAAVAAILAAFFYFMNQGFMFMEQKLRAAVPRMFDFIIVETHQRYIKDTDKKAYEKDYEKMIDDLKI